MTDTAVIQDTTDPTPPPTSVSRPLAAAAGLAGAGVALAVGTAADGLELLACAVRSDEAARRRSGRAFARGEEQPEGVRERDHAGERACGEFTEAAAQQSRRAQAARFERARQRVLEREQRRLAHPEVCHQVSRGRL